ncbi:MAG TPA: hypothetical protein VMV92_02285 [Streptosporangiaceae bacterium]|nr:hypothetical protein [Streptosporangiaceae bacterium]
MSPKRNDRVAPPPRPGEWEIRYLTTGAARGWEDLCRQVPGNTRDAYEVLRANPRPPEDSRHHRLRYDLATRKVGAQELEQWQIEVTGGGRVWYVVDDEAHTVWLVWAGTGHPKATD